MHPSIGGEDGEPSSTNGPVIPLFSSCNGRAKCSYKNSTRDAMARASLTVSSSP